jgi:hypothetical protein
MRLKLLTLVLALVTLLLSRTVPESSDPTAERRVDLVGILLLCLGLGGPVFALIQGPLVGWASAEVLAGAALGLLALPAFVAWAASAARAAVSTIAAAAPVIAVAAAVGLLAAGLVYAYQNFDGFRAVVDAVVSWLRDVAWPIQLARRFLEAGAYMIMIESEGDTENVKTWRTDVPARISEALGLTKVMFEAADPEVFAWYIKNYGPEVNLFVDHSQIVQLECLRSGIWGTKSLWGRVLTYKG